MAIQLDTFREHVGKLRRLLKHFSSDPTAEEVHALRTQSRRVLAVMPALPMKQKHGPRRVLRKLEGIRKAAGTVRDMDVLTSIVLTLSRNTRSRKNDSEDKDTPLIRLSEHLGAKRIKAAHKLADRVTSHQAEVRRALKRISLVIAKEETHASRNASSAHTSAYIKKLSLELAAWPELTEKNIHDFRLSIKQLRDVLQASDAADVKLVEALGSAKDKIGDWHDWQELEVLAKHLLNDESEAADKTLLNQIQPVQQAKLVSAMREARSLRSRYVRHSGMKSGSQ